MNNPINISFLGGLSPFGTTKATEPRAETGAELSASVESNEFWPVDDSGAITISGGTYSIGGAAYTSDAGAFTAGESLSLTGISSGEYETETTVVVTVSGTDYTFSITTESGASARYTNTDHYTGMENYT